MDVFSVCTLRGRKIEKACVIPSRTDGEGPPSWRLRYSSDHGWSTRSSGLPAAQARDRFRDASRFYS